MNLPDQTFVTRFDFCYVLYEFFQVCSFSHSFLVALGDESQDSHTLVSKVYGAPHT